MRSEIARRWRAATPDTVDGLADIAWFRAQFRASTVVVWHAAEILGVSRSIADGVKVIDREQFLQGAGS